VNEVHAGFLLERIARPPRSGGAPEKSTTAAALCMAAFCLELLTIGKGTLDKTG
jgi:hypothetical protein